MQQPIDLDERVRALDEKEGKDTLGVEEFGVTDWYGKIFWTGYVYGVNISEKDVKEFRNLGQLQNQVLDDPSISPTQQRLIREQILLREKFIISKYIPYEELGYARLRDNLVRFTELLRKGGLRMLTRQELIDMYSR